ncbi:MAG TPA: stringent starvation protein B [Myxococcales bacterium]|nr:stringent starvation protein B [Myxococcales bacterium]HIN86813.1 stringent starvation protein B [Myxococcales bacterium]
MGDFVAVSLEKRSAHKRQTLMEMLDLGMTMVHLDARSEGVCVPAQHTKDSHLRLNFSYRFRLEVLEVGEQEILASLSFDDMAFPCVIPWSAVFAMTSHVSGEFQVWQEELPEEMLTEMAESMRGNQMSKLPLKEAEQTNEDAKTDDEELEEGRTVRRVRHLRVIK